MAEQNLDGAEIVETMEVSFEEFVGLAADRKINDSELSFEALQAKLDPDKIITFRKRILGNALSL